MRALYSQSSKSPDPSDWETSMWLFAIVHRGSPTVAAVAVTLAVMRGKFGGDGWESNPPRTRHRRPANGFEDRGPVVHNRPQPCLQVRIEWSPVRQRPLSSATVRQLGCFL